MSVNPKEIINRVELGTSSLEKRIQAINQLNEAGYKTGILIAPVIMIEDWKQKYHELIKELEAKLTSKSKSKVFFEVELAKYFPNNKIEYMV